MTSTIHLWLLHVVAVSVLGQMPIPVRAGDPAPSLTWTKIVRAGSHIGGPQTLRGMVTILNFLPPVSRNVQSVTRWNKLVEKFGDRVNFVWIAAEDEKSLEPFLRTHPVSGWMVLDPQKESYSSYGIEGGGGVLINSEGTILGFSFMMPDERQIQAVLDGQAVAIKGDPTEEQMDEMFDGKLIRLAAEPMRSPAPIEKPNLPPSDEVRISPSTTQGTVASAGPDHWMQRGFDLKSIIAMISSTDPSRVQFPESFDVRSRYDFVLLPPGEEEPETMYRLVRQGIEKYFHVTITKEIRPMDVYVMTAIEGKVPQSTPENESAGGGSISSRGFAMTISYPKDSRPTRKEIQEALAKQMEMKDAVPDIASISASSTSMDEFRKGLERGLKRPIIDETKMTGAYDLVTHGDARTTEEFLGILRDQLGLVLTADQRSIEVVVVRNVP